MAKAVADECRLKLTNVGNTFGFQIAELSALAERYEDNPQLQERIDKGNTYFLTQSTDILTDFIEKEIPKIGNKTHAERYGNEFDLLKQEYELKTQILIGIINGFSLERYWAAKAKASMNEDSGNKRKTPKATKKTVRKTKTNKQKNKIT